MLTGLRNRSVVVCTPTTPAAPRYTVKRGDTLEGISATVVTERLTRGLPPHRFRDLFGVPPSGASAGRPPPEWTKNPTAMSMWSALADKHAGNYTRVVNDFVKTNTFKTLVLRPWLGTRAGYETVLAVQRALVTKNDIANPNLIIIGQQLTLLDEQELNRALFTSSR